MPPTAKIGKPSFSFDYEDRRREADDDVSFDPVENRKRRPLERMKSITDKLNGCWRADREPPYGENLRCPMPNCDAHKVTIKLGDKVPLVFCARCKAKGDPLVKAVTRATGVWLTPPPRRERPQKVVERMRRSDAYESLPSRAKALVSHLIDAVMVNGEPNGGVSRTGMELMATLGTRSRKQFYKAVNAAIAAKIVVRGSRALSNGKDSGSSNLWGLACLPREAKRSKGGGTKRGDKATQGGQSGGQPIDPAGGGCALVYEPSAQLDKRSAQTEGLGDEALVQKFHHQQRSPLNQRRAKPAPDHAGRCGGYACGKADECLAPGACPILGWRSGAPRRVGFGRIPIDGRWAMGMRAFAAASRQGSYPRNDEERTRR
jgi:hypothetical protein